MQKIIKDIDINASRERVWDILFTVENYEKWAGVFNEDKPGSSVETDAWKLWSTIKFFDGEGNGLIGRIIAHEAASHLAIEYDAELKKGAPVESEMGSAMKWVQETYTLTEENGTTHLHVTCDMDDSRMEMMSTAWDKAMLKIKELSEASA